MKPLMLLAAVAAVLSGGSAGAQDHGPVGLTMGYPGSVGVLWHVTDRVAVRPSIAWSRTSGESGDESPVAVPTIPGSQVFTQILLRTRVSSSGWTASPGVDLLLFVARWDNVGAYITPGYSYRRSSTTTTVTFEGLSIGGVQVVPSSTLTETVSLEGHEVRGAFGVQYTPHQRFGIFGELGLRHSTFDGPGGLSETRLTNSVSAVGAIFYF